MPLGSVSGLTGVYVLGLYAAVWNNSTVMIVSMCWSSYVACWLVKFERSSEQLIDADGHAVSEHTTAFN